MKIERQILDIRGIMKCMIDRKDLVRLVRSALRRSRVVALIGPRKCGKTTLAQQFLDSDSPKYFDLSLALGVKDQLGSSYETYKYKKAHLKFYRCTPQRLQIPFLFH